MAMEYVEPLWEVMEEDLEEMEEFEEVEVNKGVEEVEASPH